jgi:hypothetical protein
MRRRDFIALLAGAAGLQLRHTTSKRRVKVKLREDRRPATRSNETMRGRS